MSIEQIMAEDRSSKEEVPENRGLVGMLATALLLDHPEGTTLYEVLHRAGFEVIDTGLTLTDLAVRSLEASAPAAIEAD